MIFPVDLSKVVSVDFETYYDQKYSLRAKEYNTSEYIRDPQFKAHCVGIKIGTGETKVYWEDEIKPALDAIDWSTHYLLCHHAHFDGLILSHHYGIVPMFYLCTLSQSRALHSGLSRAGLDAVAAFYGLGNKLPNVLGKMKGRRTIPEELRPEATAYTKTDVDLMYAIFRIQIDVFPEKELRLIDLTVRMFTQPVLGVDVDLAQEEYDAEVAKKAELVEACGFSVDELMSNGKLAQVLQSLGVEPPMKISPRTHELTHAFSQQDEEFMALGAHPDERVRRVIEARLAVKSTLGETRADRFMKAAANGNRLPVYLNYCGAHTHRWSGGNKINLQNLPRGGFDANGVPVPGTRRLREAVLAPPGEVIVVCDSAQIEARTLAWFAGQQDLIDAFASGADIYSRFASEVYGHDVDRKRKIVVDGVTTQPDFEKGFVGKVCILGLGYGMGPPRFQGTLALGLMGPKVFLDLEMCQHIVWRVYRKRMNKIVEFWRHCDNVLFQMVMKRVNGKSEDYSTFVENVIEYDEQTIWMPNGLGLHYPGLKGEWDEEKGIMRDFSYRSTSGYSKIYGGLLTENIIQSAARAIVADQMLEISDKWRVVGMSHDEVICVAPRAKAEECLDDMQRIMRQPPWWAPDLPLSSEGGFDVNYSK